MTLASTFSQVSPQTRGSIQCQNNAYQFHLLSLLFLNQLRNYAAHPNKHCGQPACRPVLTNADRHVSKNDCRKRRVTMDLDLNRLNGINSIAAHPSHCISRRGKFFFSRFWFSRSMRTPEPADDCPRIGNGSHASRALAASLKRLVIEKTPRAFDLAVRDGQNGIHLF